MLFHFAIPFFPVYNLKDSKGSRLFKIACFK